MGSDATLSLCTRRVGTSTICLVNGMQRCENLLTYVTRRVFLFTMAAASYSISWLTDCPLKLRVLLTNGAYNEKA